MIELLAIPAEFLLGMAIGFFLSDKEEGLSFEEIKLSTMVFLCVNGLMFLYYPNTSPFLFVHLAFTWVVMNVGTLTGEMIRARLIQRLVDKAGSKVDAHLAVSDFIRATNRYGYQAQEDARQTAVERLGEVNAKLTRVADSSLRVTNEPDVHSRVLRIKNLCGYYLEVADAINGEDDANQKARLLNQLNETGDAITDLAWHTLQTTERTIRKSLRKTMPTRVVTMCLHR